MCEDTTIYDYKYIEQILTNAGINTTTSEMKIAIQGIVDAIQTTN